MAYPKELNNQYKSEKAAGTTTATSFPQWVKLQQVVDTSPLTDEQIDIAIMALENELMDKEPMVTLTPFINEDFFSSEEIEAGILSTTLTAEEISAIITTLNTEPVIASTNKAAQARIIYDQMELAAATSKLALIRKDIIQRFMIALPISKAGASTYLQNIKIKKGLIQSR